MPKLDGTGTDAPAGKDGLSGFEDAAPPATKNSGQGERGSGSSNQTGRSAPLK